MIGNDLDDYYVKLFTKLFKIIKEVKKWNLLLGFIQQAKTGMPANW